MKIWSIGEVLWDVFPDRELFGGAPLNFSVNLKRLGDDVTLRSAVGDDVRGHLALARMVELGLDIRGVGVVPGVATGLATVGSDANGDPSFTIPRPAAFDHLATQSEVFDEAVREHVDWIYFGTLSQIQPEVEAFIASLAGGLAGVRCFYDMNLRKDQWNLDLVRRLSSLATILKLNEWEAETLFALTNPIGKVFSLEEFCRDWSSTYGIDVICVTIGAAGCAVYARDLEGGHLATIPGYRVQVCDTVGSGDAFAAAFLHGYNQGWPLPHAAQFANALGALVASLPGGTPTWTLEEITQIQSRSLSRGSPSVYLQTKCNRGQAGTCE